MGDSGEERTEQATPKKRRDERKKGNVLMSRDAVPVLTLLGSIVVFRIWFRAMAGHMADFMRYCISLAEGNTDMLTREMLLQMLAVTARVVAIPLFVTIFIAVGVTLFQTRLLVSFELIKPKFDKLNPLNGLKNLFSLRSLVETGKNLLKITILLYLIYLSLRDIMGLSQRYLYADLTASTSHLLGKIFSMLLRVFYAFAAIAVLDFFYQRWDFEKRLKMTKQEVKEEFKQTEGDPKIKSRIRQIQREMSRSRMMQQVPQADVIIRNPTHVAVALRYRYREDPAPIVLAMGADYLAQQIIAVAEQHNITIIENIALARALYATARLNEAIPADLYEAVAEVMVYLYRLGRMQADGAPPQGFMDAASRPEEGEDTEENESGLL